MRREASFALMEWFGRSARRMEWRETDDPYRIWVSEVMLQQTRVDTVTPYYRRFLRSFPTVRALAGAPLDRVLKAWEGMGYYARARNLHKAARFLCSAHGGRLPASVDLLRELPGVGRSTAGAIAAIAYRQDEPILDANVKRVLARLHAIREELSRPGIERSLWEHSRRMILRGRGRDTALAMMDLGATVCTPRNPGCGVCPLARWCGARRLGLQEAIPCRKAAKALPHYDVVLAVVGNRRGELLIGRRPGGGFLGGLWEFPQGKRRAGESLEGALRQRVREGFGIDIKVMEKIGAVRRGYSHFRVTLHAYRCGKAGRVRTDREWKWAAPGELDRYAFPRADRKLMELFGSRQPHDAKVRERGET